VVGDIYTGLVERLIDACRSLPVKPAYDPQCRLGPVIDKASFHRLSTLINNPPEGAELLFEGNYTSPGYFIPPVLFAVSDKLNPLMQEEFFGPILTIINTDSFDNAIEIANATEFALTGAVFSRSPANLLQAREQFKVGNLYLNRGSTGALVQRQPFGGFGMSGIGTKAGGPGYLRLFADPRCITENTMRSGFTPDLQM
jgi:RHH-type proline utilization regulon transcriptional repressor/proline dehydrogenase/delta 1-pyrroline-5-carboxylate dehydrogenase